MIELRQRDLLVSYSPLVRFGINNMKDNEHGIAVKDVVELINELL